MVLSLGAASNFDVVDANEIFMQAGQYKPSCHRTGVRLHSSLGALMHFDHAGVGDPLEQTAVGRELQQETQVEARSGEQKYDVVHFPGAALD